MNRFSTFDATSLLDRLGWTLLYSLWQFALIGLLAAVVLVGMRRGSARLRYQVACAALLTMFATCLTTFCWLPASNSYSSGVREVSQQQGTFAGSAVQARGAVDSSAALAPGLEDSDLETIDRDANPVRGASWWSASSAAISRLLPGVAITWLGGVLALSLWNLGGWVGVRRLRIAGATPADAQWQATGRALLARMNIRKSVDILESTVASIPIVIGWLKPVVLLPVSVLGEMSAEQVEAVLAHELAHIRRHDYLVNLAQILIETLLFYHPAAWWISRQIRMEREHCCDDEAARACSGGALALSEALAMIVTSRLYAQSALAATGQSPSGALARVQRLLNPNGQRIRASSGATPALAMLLLSMLAILMFTQLATAEPTEAALTQAAATDDPEPNPEATPEPKPEAKPEAKAAVEPAQAAADDRPITPPIGNAPIGQDARLPMAIFVTTPDGGELRELTTTPDHTLLEQPRWSHDGKRVLFTGERGPRGGRDFYVVNADGTKLTRLGAYGHADWSPDDEQILFDVYTPARRPAPIEFDLPPAPGERPAAEQGRGSYVQKIDGTEDAKISKGLCPRWSPDGSKIAVTDHKMLYVIDLARDEEMALFEVPFEYIFSGYNWSPDGKWLALSAKTAPKSRRKLLLVSAEGEKKGLKQLRVGEQGGSIAFSPDGKRLVFSAGYQLRTLDIDGDGKDRVIPGVTGRAQDPHWSPDGKWIVFSGERKPAEDKAPPAETPAGARGMGLRINVPAMGPAPIALDFAGPVDQSNGNRQPPFHFFVGSTR
jgi:beta-lactamase regulating signal transducer with metallopeptidase domain